MERYKDGGTEDGEDAAVDVAEEAEKEHRNARSPLAKSGWGLDGEFFLGCRLHGWGYDSSVALKQKPPPH
jgi:hypothetical protein